MPMAELCIVSLRGPWTTQPQGATKVSLGYGHMAEGRSGIAQRRELTLDPDFAEPIHAITINPLEMGSNWPKRDQPCHEGGGWTMKALKLG